MTIKRLMMITFSLTFLFACGTSNQENQNEAGTNQEEQDDQNDRLQNEETEDDQTPTEDESSNQNRNEGSNDQDYMSSQMNELDFKNIEIEISYEDDQEYEATIEQDHNRPIKAEVEDELNNVYIVGREAFDDIYEKAKELSLSHDSSDEDAIEQVLNAFDLSEDYEKFEIEIKFNDGSELEIEHRK